MLLLLPIVLIYYTPKFYLLFSLTYPLFSIKFKMDDNCMITLLTQKQREHLSWCENKFSNKEKTLSVAADDS